MRSDSNSFSAAPPSADSATTSISTPPAAEAVAHTIQAAHRVIADAHQHGRKRVSTFDWMLARLHFAVARRLARWAYGFAVRGKGRLQ